MNNKILITVYVPTIETELDILKEKQIIARGNYLKIKARGNLSKRFVIIADEYDPEVIRMVVVTGGNITKLVK